VFCFTDYFSEVVIAGVFVLCAVAYIFDRFCFSFFFCFFLSSRGATRGGRGCQRCLCRSLLLKYRDSSISSKIAAFKLGDSSSSSSSSPAAGVVEMVNFSAHKNNNNNNIQEKLQLVQAQQHVVENPNGIIAGRESKTKGVKTVPEHQVKNSAEESWRKKATTTNCEALDQSRTNCCYLPSDVEEESQVQ
jgi:hypothetical protein